MGYVGRKGGCGLVLDSLSNVALKHKLEEAVSVKDFGAVGDGITDDTVAIQNALNTKKEVYFPPGKYRTTSELVFSDGCKVKGAGVPYGIYPSVPDQDWDMAINSWIFYDGTAGDDVAVCRFSDYAVGVEPTGTQLTNQTIKFTDMGIDGNNKAGIGAYYVRPRGEFARYTVKGTTKHAHLFLNLGACTFYDVGAVRNYGKGFTLGDNIYSWSAQFCDESVFIRPFAMFNGLSATWNNTTNIKDGYGFGVFDCRGITVVGIESSQNDGAGIYYANIKPNVLFLGGYTEFNTNNDVTYDYGIIVNGDISGWNAEFKNINIRDDVYLTGNEPSRSSTAVIFDGCSFIGSITADWDNYRLINGDEFVTINGTKPAYNIGNFNTYDSFQTVGIGYVDFSTGAVGTNTKAGVIDSYTYVGVGSYRVNLVGGFTDGQDYIVVLTGGANRLWGISAQNAANFLIDHRTNAGAVIDSNAKFNITIVKI